MGTVRGARFRSPVAAAANFPAQSLWSSASRWDGLPTRSAGGGGRGAEAARDERKARAQESPRLLGRPPAPPSGWARARGSRGPRGRLRGGWGRRTEAACFPLSAGHVRWCGTRSSAGDSCTPPWPRRYRVWGEAGGSEPERSPVLSAHSATDWSPLQNKRKKN